MSIQPISGTSALYTTTGLKLSSIEEDGLTLEHSTEESVEVSRPDRGCSASPTVEISRQYSDSVQEVALSYDGVRMTIGGPYSAHPKAQAEPPEPASQKGFCERLCDWFF